MLFDLHAIKNLADKAASLTDDRPDLLKNLPSAMDSTALYYKFFDMFIQKYAPMNIVEIGTYYGVSAAHLSYNNKGGMVTTIDIDPTSKTFVSGLGIKNINSIIGNSLAVADSFPKYHFDVCFIDGAHNFQQALKEYHAYRPLVKKNGLMFFDDIDIDEEMKKFWEIIFDPKQKLDALHYTGFGVCQKS